jgi:cellobiose transport system substrate-binding protein
MCYRTDLFAQAGLPTDRQAVSALWPTWDAYINAGKTFVSKVPSSHWVDAATNTYNTILMQQGDHTYFDKKNAFVMSSNASVRKAWDITMQMINAKESANLAAFQDPWNAGFKNGAFATIACPSWMVGYIQGQAGDAGNGKWDVASLPGGGGNWGGSFLTLPKIGKHHKEAYDLAVWLTSAQQQLKVFQVVGNFPSAVKLYDKPELTGFKNAYMNNAPVGQIFVDGAKKNKPVYLGPTNGAVRLAVENDIRLVEQGRSTSDDAWQRALTDGKKAAS